VLLLSFGVTTGAVSQVARFDSLAQTSPDSLLLQELQRLEGTPLSLSRALGLALENSTDINEARAAVMASEGLVRREKGGFDPEFFADAVVGSSDLPASSPFAGAQVVEAKEASGSGGIRSQFRTGTELEASLNASRDRTNSAFAALNPQYTTFAALTVRHPLLAGGGAAANRELRAAEYSRQADQDRLIDALYSVQSQVEETYWDLWAAERNYAVQLLIRDRAESLVDEANLRVQAGLAGPNQLENARVFLAQQELAVIDRREFLGFVSDELASLIGARPAADAPLFRPMEAPPVTFDVGTVDSLVDLAASRNHALSAFRSDIDALGVRLSAAKRNRLPTVDLIGSLGGNGLAGDAQDVIFGQDTLRSNRDGSLGDAIGQAVTGDFPNWQVGVDIVIPIGRRAKTGEIARLEGEVERAEHRYVALGRSIEQEVRRRHRELANGSQRLAVAQMGVEAAREQVRIGMIEFRNGRTTAFELVRLGADFAEAEQRYSQALVRTAKAVAALNRLTAGGYAAPEYDQE
jgi:outer membrane protein TolC